MPDALTDRLFVYGSLRSQFGNRRARRLQAEGDLLGRATVRGSIFRIAAYPGYKHEPDGVVIGELWRLRTPECTLAALDDYEGTAYSRITVDLDRPLVSAWIYLYLHEVDPDKRIHSGDFLAQ